MVSIQNSSFSLQLAIVIIRLGIVTDCPPYAAVNRRWPSFSVAAPRLPQHVTSAPSLAIFRSRLKTHLFRRYFPWLHRSPVVPEKWHVITDMLIVFVTYLLNDIRPTCYFTQTFHLPDVSVTRRFSVPNWVITFGWFLFFYMCHSPLACVGHANKALFCSNPGFGFQGVPRNQRAFFVNAPINVKQKVNFDFGCLYRVRHKNNPLRKIE